MAKFEFSVCSDEIAVSSLSLGDLTIIGNVQTVTSKGDSRYLMMVFLSIPFLLDGLQHFLSTRSASKYEFVGLDGSFRVMFFKKSPDMVVIQVFGQVVSREKISQLVPELWNSVQSFVSRYRGQFLDTDTGVQDLDASMRDFSAAFAPLLGEI